MKRESSTGVGCFRGVGPSVQERSDQVLGRWKDTQTTNVERSPTLTVVVGKTCQRRLNGQEVQRVPPRHIVGGNRLTAQIVQLPIVVDVAGVVVVWIRGIVAATSGQAVMGKAPFGVRIAVVAFGCGGRVGRVVRFFGGGRIRRVEEARRR